ncbi:ANKRD50 [Symbiodinium natans]|uniref:ANKRD50 protein n=1 Tax=Symbiodinium natans TaxID=878477 RepID=A0A812M7T8_9DINO|nr:ANKRD50 [Symbiodinium natans]
MYFQPYDNRGYFILDRIETASMRAILVTAFLQLWCVITNDADVAVGNPMFAQIRNVSCTIIIVLVHLRFFWIVIWGLGRRRIQKWTGTLADAVRAYRGLQGSQHSRASTGVVVFAPDGLHLRNLNYLESNLLESMFAEMLQLHHQMKRKISFDHWSGGLQLLCLEAARTSKEAAVQSLAPVCGVPRFRQRLLHGGVPLEDGVKLETPMDLQLLLLPLTGTTASDVHLFVDAVRTKGAEEIEEMLSKGQDANVVEFWTPLKYAAQQGRADVVQLLLEANAEADGKTDQTRRTPLWAASQAGHVEAVRLLLEARAAHNVQDSPEGRTPLFVATEEGHYEVMRVLLEAGADRDLRSSRGRTPLHQACVDLEAMDLLVKARADIAKADQNGETPLTKACRVNSVAAMRLLLEACPEQPKSGALSAASGLGFTELLGLLLALYADVGTTTADHFLT